MLRGRRWFDSNHDTVIVARCKMEEAHHWREGDVVEPSLTGARYAEILCWQKKSRRCWAEWSVSPE
ncbi:hypothetical protein KCP69_22000 [Salmonella enterica subsp. enterica]|nr:hypothetical protein KCP69_22000 [Salmonella enterica subsp. enterica]